MTARFETKSAKRRICLRIAILAVAIGLAAASAILSPAPIGAEGRSIAATEEQTPLIAFFDGPSRSRGTITTGLVSTRSFTATFDGHYAGGHLELEERFSFDDGEAIQVWTLSTLPGSRLTGSVRTQLADDTLAAPRPVTGTVGPDRAVLNYDGYAPNGGDTLLRFHHVMTRQADGTVRNAVTVSKFYLPLATSRVTFYKR